MISVARDAWQVWLKEEVTVVTLRVWKSLFWKKQLSWQIFSSFVPWCCCKTYQLKREMSFVVLQTLPCATSHKLQGKQPKTHRETGEANQLNCLFYIYWNCHKQYFMTVDLIKMSHALILYVRTTVEEIIFNQALTKITSRGDFEHH